ncbi:hypothetical protein BGZ83_002144, partial [Gryganskiella cystojenkinii]
MAPPTSHINAASGAPGFNELFLDDSEGDVKPPQQQHPLQLPEQLLLLMMNSQQMSLQQLSQQYPLQASSSEMGANMNVNETGFMNTVLGNLSGYADPQNGFVHASCSMPEYAVEPIGQHRPFFRYSGSISPNSLTNYDYGGDIGNGLHPAMTQ